MKEMHLEDIHNKNIIIKGIVFAIIIIVLFSGCLWSGPEIAIKKYDIPPGQYVELTEEELKEYPALEKAINGSGCIKKDGNYWRCKINSNELGRTMTFTNEKRQNNPGETFFKVGEKYYAVAYITN